MNIVVAALLAVNVLSVTVVLIAQRANRHIDLLKSGALRLETSAIAGTSLAHPHIYAEHGKLVVKGCVQREPGATLTGSGQVQVQLRSPEGTALERSVAMFSLSPDPNQRCARFRADFSSVPPEGTTAVLKWGLSAPAESAESTRRLRRRSEPPSTRPVGTDRPTSSPAPDE